MSDGLSMLLVMSLVGLLAVSLVRLEATSFVRRGFRRALRAIGEVFGLPPIRVVMLLVLALVLASMAALFDTAVIQGQMSQGAFVTTIAFAIGLCAATFVFQGFFGHFLDNGQSQGQLLRRISGSTNAA